MLAYRDKGFENEFYATRSGLGSGMQYAYEDSKGFLHIERNLPIEIGSTDYGHTDQTNPKSNLKQLPCKTYISTGCCPYRDRCVFLHDSRIGLNNTIKLNCKKKQKEDGTTDSLFWPPSSMTDTGLQRKSAGYTVPRPQEKDKTINSR